MAAVPVPSSSSVTTSSRSSAISGWNVIEGSRLRILGPESDSRIGENLNGPTVIRVPKWIPNPLGKYYMYFGHHGGTFIRLAYADHPEGPWTVHSPGCLDLAEAPQLYSHIASPEIVIEDETQQMRMYFHGPGGQIWWQETAVAFSKDGLHFDVQPGVLAPFYLRVFRWKGRWLGIARDGGNTSLLLESPDGLQPFYRKRAIFQRSRHVGLYLQGDTLWAFYSCIGDAPERILVSRVELKGPVEEWEFPDGTDLMRPRLDWEGINFPLAPSRPSAAINKRQIRDPFIFEEEDQFYMYYCAAAESCLGVVRLQPSFDGDASERASDPH